METDEDGNWDVFPQASGAVVRVLVAPSPMYVAKQAAMQASATLDKTIATKANQLDLLQAALIKKGLISEADLHE